MPRRPSALQTVAVLLVLLPVVVGSVTAAPPPRPVCGACGDALEDRADDYGLALSVTNSTARVVVHKNRTATWVVRNRIEGDAAVERLRTNETLREAVVRARYWDVELQSVTVSSDGVLTARYVQTDFAERSVGGTLRVDAFHGSFGYRNLEDLGADRLVVEAPDGTAVRSSVPGSEVSDDRSRVVLTSYDRGGFLTFVPRDHSFEAVWGWLAVASLLGPLVARNVAVRVLPVAAVVGIATGVLGDRVRPMGLALQGLTGDPGRVLAALGGLGILVATLGRLEVLLGVAVAATSGGLAWSRFGTAWVTRRRLAGVTAFVAAGASVVVVAVSVIFHGQVWWARLSPALVRFAALLAFVPAGHALAQGARGRTVLLPVGAVLAALLATVSLTARSGFLGPVGVLIVAMVQGAILAAPSIAALAIGATIAVDGEQTAGRGHNTQE